MKITVEYTAREDSDFIAKAQSFCKIFRSKVIGISLDAMAEKLNLKKANLVAWENGRSNKAEYLFYYHDLTDDESMRRTFCDCIFESDGKDIIVDTSVSLDNGLETASIKLKDRPKKQ